MVFRSYSDATQMVPQMHGEAIYGQQNLKFRHAGQKTQSKVHTITYHLLFRTFHLWKRFTNPANGDAGQRRGEALFKRTNRPAKRAGWCV